MIDDFYLQRRNKFILTQKRRRADINRPSNEDKSKALHKNFESQGRNSQFHEILRSCRSEEIKGNYKSLQKLSIQLLENEEIFSSKSSQLAFTVIEDDEHQTNMDKNINNSDESNLMKDDKKYTTGEKITLERIIKFEENHKKRLTENMVGLSYFHLGDYNKASQHLLRAKDIANEIARTGFSHDSYTDIGGILNDLAVLEAHLGNMKNGYKYLKRCVFMAERAYRVDHDLLSTAFHNYGEFAMLENDPDRALQYYQKAREYKSHAEREDRQITDTKEMKNNFKSGECSYQEKLFQAQSNNMLMDMTTLERNNRSIITLFSLGELTSYLHSSEEGIIYVNKALKLCRRFPSTFNNIIYAKCLLSLANIQIHSLARNRRLTLITHLLEKDKKTEDNGSETIGEIAWDPQALVERALSILQWQYKEDHYYMLVASFMNNLTKPLSKAMLDTDALLNTLHELIRSSTKNKLGEQSVNENLREKETNKTVPISPLFKLYEANLENYQVMLELSKSVNESAIKHSPLDAIYKFQFHRRKNRFQQGERGNPDDIAEEDFKSISSSNFLVGVGIKDIDTSTIQIQNANIN